MKIFAVVLSIAVVTNIVVTLINCLLDTKVSFVVAENLRIQMDIDVYENQLLQNKLICFATI